MKLLEYNLSLEETLKNYLNEVYFYICFDKWKIIVYLGK